MMKLMSSHSSLGLSNSKTHCQEEETGGQVVDRLLASNFILAEDWDALPLPVQERILCLRNRNEVIQMLMEHGVLTEYQGSRIMAGTTFGLVLGSYRILDRIGAGGMAIVFKAEHADMRHTVAIKVLPMSQGQDSRLETRFFSEMRVVAQLRHPNIVSATDAGRLFNPDPSSPSLRFLVMEYVAGQDLEEYIRNFGPLPIHRACSLAYQIASALAETHKFNLVHRDIKPSNIMVTPEEQAKLLDFGLSRHFQNRMTVPGTVLGTIDFMAPEQARDSSTVDIRADLYSLGGVLFWSLTGQLPFTSSASPIENLAKRLNQPPPSLREFLPECPAELDDTLKRMMATAPDDRYPTPQAVMQALLPFLRSDSPEQLPLALARTSMHQSTPSRAVFTNTQRVLIVDDEPEIRHLCRHLLQAQDMECDEVEDGCAAIKAVTEHAYDLILLDVNMPGMTGAEALQQLRQLAQSEHMKIIMFSGQASPDEMSQMMLNGADDYLAKPFSVVQFLGRVRAALRLKTAQDRSIILNNQLMHVNAELEFNLKARDSDVQQTRNSLVVGLARLIDQRDSRGRNHTERMQRYCRALAEGAMRSPSFNGQIDRHYIEMLESAVPLHDVGKIALPDHILLKGGTFTTEERILMQTHTTIASETLQEVAKLHAGAAVFLRIAIDIMRHHHERHDGTGYPDRLAGNGIPLAARIVAIADVYDALRCRRVYKPALAHNSAFQIITQASRGQFDPNLIEVFASVGGQFEAIFQELQD
ncbi:MAG: protein kinase [Planctomycetes bacterium]|nr:protein kinase [Planctomycetota bacterium]